MSPDRPVQLSSCRPDVAEHAKLFEALEYLHVEHTLHTKVFDAIQSGVELRDTSELVKWLDANSVNKSAFFARYGQLGAESPHIQRFADITAKHGIAGVPTFVINGKYMTSPASNNGDIDKTLLIAVSLTSK